MKLIFSEQAWKDYLFWQKQDRKMLARINMLIKEVQRLPFQGIGNPEPLKHELSGYWSRRINKQHRLVYKADDTAVFLASCRFHY